MFRVYLHVSAGIPEGFTCLFYYCTEIVAISPITIVHGRRLCLSVCVCVCLHINIAAFNCYLRNCPCVFRPRHATEHPLPRTTFSIVFVFSPTVSSIYAHDTKYCLCFFTVQNYPYAYEECTRIIRAVC